jgi:hypothetical protein
MNSPLAVTLKADPNRKLLWVSYSGEFSLAEAELTFHEILGGLEQHKLNKVLVDGRQILGSPEPLERFYYGKYVAEAVAKAVNASKIEVPRLAYVLTEPALDPNRLGETVAINRGMRVKAFDDLKAGLWWLGIEADDVSG